MSARLTDDTTLALHLDDLHEAAIVAACGLDAEFARRHPDAASYVRAGLDHELCAPSQPCSPWPERVLVMFIAPGVRARLAA